MWKTILLIQIIVSADYKNYSETDHSQAMEI